MTARDARNYNLSDGGGITHQYFAGPVLRPFGYGLSYTRFEYAWTSGGAAVAAAGGVLDVTGGNAAAALSLDVRVSNVGPVASDCVVLAFVTPPRDGTAHLHGARATDALPLQTLLGFERLRELAPGETRSWRLRVDALALAVTDGTGARVVVPGEYVLRIGGVDGMPAAEARVRVAGSGLVEVQPASAALLKMAQW